MRRDQAVRRRQPGDQRDGQAHDRRLGRARQREDDGGEQHQSDVEEDGQADHERDQHDGPGKTGMAEHGDDARGHDRGPARLGEHLAEDCAETNHDGDEPQRGADAVLEGLRDARQRQAGADAGNERRDRYRDERVQLHPRDQHDEQDDGDRGGNQGHAGSWLGWHGHGATAYTR